MTLGSGAKFGAYEVVSRLGAGGMGEVYRARDTRLNRDVAIKVLPPLFASDAERLARFTREAQTLASLNHPNIAAIYGLEELPGDAGRALVMELVEGDDLSALLGGPLSVEEALPIARQIVDGLEAAHESGIVHRDLKPANVKVRSDGTVKILDFGLAKAVAGDAAEQGFSPANSPTLTMRATQMGVILGTAAYMSPEQARGKPVDKRTDVWAFGCVLYEMLTGKRAFDGEDATEIISAVVKTEPDWKALPATVPAHVRDIVTRCLVKDRKARIPDVSIIRYMLDTSIGAGAASTPAVAASSRMSFLWQAAAVISLLLAVVAGVAWYRARSVTPPSARFLIDAPENTTFMVGRRSGTAAVISPDGRTLAFAVRDGSGRLLLWLRPIAALAAHPLPGTDGASYPFWSPDGRWIAYSTGGKLMKVSAAGGQPVELATAASQGIVGRGGSWNLENVIVFNNGPQGLLRVSSSGGQTQPVGRNPRGALGLMFPSFLPDGRHILAYGESGDEDVRGLYVVSLDTGESKRILGTTTGGIYSPETGHLLYGRDGILLAQRFDPVAFTVAGDPMTIGERLEDSIVPGMMAFSLSSNGVLAYGTSNPAGMQSELVWVGRNGAVQGTLAQAAPYLGVELSPDRRYVAVHQHEGDGGDIVVIEASTGRAIKFTSNAGQDNWSPVWSRDGTRIAYASRRNGIWGVSVKPWNTAGDEIRIFEPDGKTTLGARPWDWSPEDSIVQSMIDLKLQASLYRIPLSGDRRPVQLTESSGLTVHVQISPDGRWLAYTSIEAGEARVHVRSLASGARWPVSAGAGVMPRWRGDGRELFYFGGTSLMAVDVATSGSSFEAGKPHALFEHGSGTALGRGSHLDGSHFRYAAADTDGQRFLVARPPAGAAGELKQQPIAVVLNWPEALKTPQ